MEREPKEIEFFPEDEGDGVSDSIVNFADGAFWEKMTEIYNFDQEMVAFYEARLDHLPNNPTYNKALVEKYRRWCAEPRGAGYVPGKKK